MPKTISILYVEDDTAFRALAVSSLQAEAQKWGYDLRIKGVALWSEAAQVAAAYEAVILDLTLPDSPRPDTVARMRVVAPLWPPIVVATGHDSAAVQMDCMWAGASDWMPKELAISAPAQFLARLIHAIIRPLARAKLDGHAPH